MSDNRSGDGGNCGNAQGGSGTTNGSNGNDVLNGGSGNDAIYGGNGNDQISGGSGNDVLNGGSGNDVINGGAGNDRVSGGSGNDTIYGGAGNDNIDAGSGNDTIVGGAGNDVIDGGAGIDVAVYSGKFSDYKLTLSNDGGHQGPCDDDTSAMTVHDLRAGSPDGVDTLKNIEILRFADGEYRDGHFYPNNTPAVIGNPTAANVTEDTSVSSGLLKVAGTISISDADAGQAAFQTSVAGAAGNLGTLTLAANGAYTYAVANSAVQYLGAADSKVDSFTITSVDGTTKVVSFTIHGMNDTAVIGAPTVSSVTEDIGAAGGLLKAVGTISVADVDAGQANFQTGVTGAAGNLGALVLASNGSYTYSVDNNAVQYLGAGATKVDSFTITSQDGTSKVVSFTINGANDAAVIGTPTVASVTEDSGVVGGLLKAVGSISITDADTGQGSLQTTVIGAAGNLGSLVLAANGSYTYAVSNSAVQYLGAGDTRVDSFTIKSLDGTTKVVSFTVNGANDAAVIGTPTVSSVTEDAGVSGGLLKAVGTISVADVDAGQANFQTGLTGAAGNLGALVLASNGSYTYSVDNSAVQYLGAGVTKVDSFTISSLDGTTKVVSFTIIGANDGALIGNPSVASVTEDASPVGGLLTAVGTISIADVDLGQNSLLTTVAGAAGNLGSLVLAANGAYVYAVSNSAVQYLGAGDTKVDSFTITSLDGTSKVVNFTINGTNDAAVIGAQAPAVMTEDVSVDGSGNLTSTGALSIADLDAGQNVFQTGVIATAGNLGSLVMAANGSYAYSVANSAVQFLGAGVSKVDSFTVSSLDGTTKVLNFTINGTNDGAVIGSPTVASVTEDSGVDGSGLLKAVGTIAIADVDAGQAFFQTSVVGAGTNLGTLVLGTSGAYTYSVANSAVQFLGAGATKIDTFTITSLDGSSKVVSFTINGTNDGAVIGSPSPADVTEDSGVSGGNLKASGTLSIHDADAGQEGFLTTVVGAAGNLGSLVLAANGAYTYAVANAAVQSMGAGDTRVDSFTVASLDGTTKVVNFTIHGVNDAAVIGTPSVNAVTEDVAVGVDGRISASGTLAISDVDAGQAHFQTVVAAAPGTLGTLLIDANGGYTYSVADSAVQSLGAGDSKVENFTVTSLDGTTQTATFTIHGANDAAVIGAPTVSGVTEGVGVVGGNLTAVGSIAISDVDTGQSVFQTAVAGDPANLGTLVLAADGSYTYTVDNSLVQYLDAGETRVDSFTVTSLDGTTQTVSFTVTGVSNDAAVIGYPSVDAVTEDLNPDGAGQLSASGLISITDVNAGEASFQASVASALGNLGTLVIAADGSYTYAVDNSAVQYLGAGQDKVEQFTVTSLDGTTQTETFTIHGVNDAAQIGDPSNNTVAEGAGVVAGQLSVSGTIPIGDVDTGESAFQTVVSDNGSNLGTLVLASDGSYTYSVPNSDVQYLASGTSRVEEFTVTSLDGTTHTVSFTINGASAAVIGAPSVDAVTEDVSVDGGGMLTASGMIPITDADPGQSVFQTDVLSAPGNLGTLSIAADGSYTYSVDNNAVQYLGQDSVKVEDFTVTSADGTTQTVSFSIHGANDAPVAVDETRTILEDQPVVMTAASASDADAGDTLTIIAAPSVDHGTVELVDGVLTFRPDLNYSGPASFSYTVTDQNGATATATVSLDVQAVADAPVIPVPANLGFELASFHNWDILGSVGLASNLDGVSPFDGSARMAKLDSSWVEQGDLERFLGVATGALNGLAGEPYNGNYWDYNPAVDTGVFNNVTDGSAMRTTLAVSDGQVVSFDYDFVSGDEKPYGDFGFVVINGVAQRLAGIMDVGSYGTTGWQHFEYTVDLDGGAPGITSGIVTLGFGVVDTGDIDANSQLLVDNVRFNGSAADGNEDTAILIPVASALADTDGSESLSLTTISGVPFGALLSAGTDNHDGTWTLTQADLPNLTITPPHDYFGTFTLTVSATSTESSNGDQATTSNTFNVTVYPVSDGVGAEADSQIIVPVESHTVGLNISAPAGIVGDVLIASVPTNGDVTTANGTLLTAGTHVSGADLAGLSFTPMGATGSNSGLSYTWTDTSGTHTHTDSMSLVNATGAIRVGVVYSFEHPIDDGLGGQMPLSAVAAGDLSDQLNDNSYFQFSADMIQLNASDSTAVLLATFSSYDVIISAGANGDLMTDAYWSALRQYVETNQGGVITTGSFADTLHSTSLASNPDADFVSPITPAGETTIAGADSTFSVTGGHAITYGMEAVPGPGIDGTVLDAAVQIDVNAVSLADSPAGGSVIAYTDQAGMGRTVYLGEPYNESEVSGIHTEPVRSGYADQLLEQAVHWAANGKALTQSVTLDGGSGNDVLSGGADNDVISGNDGNDQLSGGLGSDTLTGGNGSDRFYYNAGDINPDSNDTITDFQTGTGGDVLDIHDLLSGYNAGSSLPGQFVQLVDISGLGTEVVVDGSGSGTNYTPVALLMNVTMSPTLLDDLLTQGNLHLG